MAAGTMVELPAPRTSGRLSLEEVLARRRSVREYRDAPLTLPEAAQLLWAAYGETDADGHRTAPSAGALYPLEVYLVAARVEGLEAGVYHYLPGRHALRLVKAGDVRRDLMAAALDQACVGAAAAHVVLAAVYERTTVRYGQRGRRYVHLDAGHAGQNVYLQAEALQLATVVVGAFDDRRVQTILGLPEDQQPLSIMPIGRR
jgi:SagB-type dehydrogenase family enzyme